MFRIFFKKALEKFIDSIKIYNISYADDTVVIADSYVSLQWFLNNITKEIDTWVSEWTTIK